MPDHKSHGSKSESSHEQLSESAASRTTDPNQPAPQRKEHKEQPQGSEPGKHGRPTDDTDPGHS